MIIAKFICSPIASIPSMVPGAIKYLKYLHQIVKVFADHFHYSRLSSNMILG